MKIYIKTKSLDVLDTIQALVFTNSKFEVTTGDEVHYQEQVAKKKGYDLVLESDSIEELEVKLMLQILKAEFPYSLGAA